MYCYYYNEDSRMLLLNVLSSLNFIFVASTCSSAGSNILNTEKCDCRSNTCLSLSLCLSLTWLICPAFLQYFVTCIKIIKYKIIFSEALSVSVCLIIVHVLDCCHKIFSIGYIL